MPSARGIGERSPCGCSPRAAASVVRAGDGQGARPDDAGDPRAVLAVFPTPVLWPMVRMSTGLLGVAPDTRESVLGIVEDLVVLPEPVLRALARIVYPLLGLDAEEASEVAELLDGIAQVVTVAELDVEATTGAAADAGPSAVAQVLRGVCALAQAARAAAHPPAAGAGTTDLPGDPTETTGDPP